MPALIASHSRLQQLLEIPSFCSTSGTLPSNPTDIVGLWPDWRLPQPAWLSSTTGRDAGSNEYASGEFRMPNDELGPFGEFTVTLDHLKSGFTYHVVLSPVMLEAAEEPTHLRRDIYDDCNFKTGN
ncbi:unnamed protein product [Protopolystoma xenopodis]|uniref:Uncharacterized protein n=1 Tax=Protopolystoma xenopodis TaxID=117903 RepID=A0A448X0N7_9PLAT|nr:unnamed protein product [Protopolystoma xenopodis]